MYKIERTKIVGELHKTLNKLLEENKITKEASTIISKTVVDTMPNKFADNRVTVVDLNCQKDLENTSDIEEMSETLDTKNKPKNVQYVRCYNGGLGITKNKQLNSVMFRLSRDFDKKLFKNLIWHFKNLPGFVWEETAIFYITKSAVKLLKEDFNLPDEIFIEIK